MLNGDVFSDKKWRDYYNMDEGIPKYGYFTEGCLIGVLIDMDRGNLTFYKDGIDLGIAVISPLLKKGTLHPFILC